MVTTNGIARHRAFLYGSVDEFVDVVGTFLRDGIDAGEACLAILAPERADWLRAALGPGLGGAEVLDAEATYRPPAAATALFASQLRTTSPGRLRRVVAEAPIGTWREGSRRDHRCREAAMNVLLDQLPTTVLCPYDAQALDAEVLEGCWRVHPVVHAQGGHTESEHFVEPRAFVAQEGRVVLPPEGAPTISCEAPGELALARRFVRERCRAAGRSPAVTEELTVAAGEVLTNAIVHGAPPRRLFAYLEDGALVLHVQDRGAGLADPLAGFLPPADGATQGRGLWAARQLADVVEVASDASGTHVRIISLAGSGGRP